ncbi:MAG: hypothetical protein HY286_07945 [Planctomycetes bacterium]|nr:hypothetical protein [Planctomycetota bacterium]
MFYKKKALAALALAALFACQAEGHKNLVGKNGSVYPVDWTYNTDTRQLTLSVSGNATKVEINEEGLDSSGHWVSTNHEVTASSSITLLSNTQWVSITAVTTNANGQVTNSATIVTSVH